MSEGTKIFNLRARLSPALKQEIPFRDEPEATVEFVKVLKKEDTKMKVYQAENSGRHPQHAPSPAAAIAATARPRPRPPPPPTPARASHPAGGKVPMDLSAGRRQISQTERDAQMREGRCFNYRGIGHMSSTYPAKRRPRGRPAFRISAAAAAPGHEIDLLGPIVPALPGGNA
ncbi:hypothetical protein Q9L58_007838 [Maublancomyces gigas]|uniref:Uncharacterized protein n=1 Tax=Discina gigas TaxID=1032678 RepID=A0ABR3GBH1_9PEZI